MTGVAVKHRDSYTVEEMTAHVQGLLELGQNAETRSAYVHKTAAEKGITMTAFVRALIAAHFGEKNDKTMYVNDVQMYLALYLQAQHSLSWGKDVTVTSYQHTRGKENWTKAEVVSLFDKFDKMSLKENKDLASTTPAARVRPAKVYSADEILAIAMNKSALSDAQKKAVAAALGTK